MNKGRSTEIRELGRGSSRREKCRWDFILQMSLLQKCKVHERVHSKRLVIVSSPDEEGIHRKESACAIDWVHSTFSTIRVLTPETFLQLCSSVQVESSNNSHNHQNKLKPQSKPGPVRKLVGSSRVGHKISLVTNGC